MMIVTAENGRDAGHIGSGGGEGRGHADDGGRKK